jgi:hypothetical protein
VSTGDPLAGRNDGERYIPAAALDWVLWRSRDRTSGAATIVSVGRFAYPFVLARLEARMGRDLRDDEPL